MNSNSDRQNFLSVLGVVLAGVIQVSSSEGPFTYWNVIIGIVLCLVLSNYSLSPSASKRERFALAVTWGFIVMSGAGFIFQELYRWANNTWLKSLPEFLDNGEAPSGYYFILWLIISAIAWFVLSRRRAGRRTPASE